MAKDRNIYLIGPMGSGKTAVGQALAKQLKRRFLDTDSWIERRTRQSVEDIFAKKGEAHFRKLETRVVRQASRRRGSVIALGGGAPCQPAVQRVLATGITVRLTCRQRELWQRVAAKRHARPLLKAATAAESRAQLAALLRRRAAAYPKGDVQISTTRLGAKAAARRLAVVLKRKELA